MRKDALHAKIQEAIRKDIERAFRVLLKNYKIFVHASRFMTVEIMDKIVRCLVNLHNMCVEELIEDDGELGANEESDEAAMVGKDKMPMSGEFIRLSTSSLTPSMGSVDDLCKVRR